jgi:serine/threonine protein phosphatase 1
MPKLFVVSDIHSHYKPFREALDEAGFDPDNKDHWLISCGDVFDRGLESVELFKLLMSIDNKILVKGNHDILLEQCCTRGFPYTSDKHNGTVQTIKDFGASAMEYDFEKCCEITYNKLARYRELLVNYFETQNYIFVHSWIPTHKDVKPHPADKWIDLAKDEWMEDWRNANDVEWEDAMWGNPFWKAQDGLNQTGKTIVFGHWHCSLGHLCDSQGELSEFGENACWEPYFNEEQKIIGIDRCTAYTGKCNVIVLEDDFLEN